MRVLVVSDVSGWMPGGVPAETVQLLEGLRDRGHAVALAGDIPLGGEGAGHYPLTLPTGTALAREVEAAMTAFRPDVVHVIAMSSRGVARLGPVLSRVPWVFTCHSVPPHERKLAHFHAHETLHYAARALRLLPNTVAWRWLLARQAMPWVIVHSAGVGKIVVGYGCAPERAVLIPLTHDGGWPPAGSQAMPGDAPVILTVGGVAHTKGQHDMLTALAAVARRHRSVRYRMIGELRDRSYGEFLDRRIAALGLSAHVERLHGLDHVGKIEALRSAHLYVQPSHEEGFCLAFIEAAGVVPRLVGTDTGAIGAMCADDPEARVVAPRAPDALAAAVLDLLGRESPAGLLAARHRRLAERFSRTAYFEAHEALYERAMREARAS